MAARGNGPLYDVRGLVDGVLADRDATLLDFKRHITRELSFDPKPQALQALSALRDVSDPKARELGTRAATLHLTVDRLLFELWDSQDTSDAVLDRRLAMIEPLRVLIADEEKALEATLIEIDRMQRDALARLCSSLVLPEEPLLAALVVVPEVARLSAAARAGKLAEAGPSLTHEERETIVATISPATSSRPDRVLLDAIALRTAMEASIGAYLEAGRKADGVEAAGRERVESLRLAHGVVSARLDAVRAEHFANAKKGDRRIDDARSRLFAAYLQLTKALAGSPIEDAHTMQEEILDAEREGAAVDRQKSARDELMRHAAAGVSRAAPMELSFPPDVRTLRRERKRKRVLIGVAAALVPIALIANLISWSRSAPPTNAAVFLETAVPVQELYPIGQSLYCQVAKLLWEDLTEAERMAKVTAFGKIALQRGYKAVMVVDEDRHELARWSASTGPEVGKASDSGTE